MRDARTVRTAWGRIAAGLLALALAPACAPKTARRQTDIMAKTGVVRVSATELRIRVNALAERMSGALEVTADRIRAETADPAVRRRALVFKIESVPAVYSAAYRADPMVAAMDTWALALQIAQYVEDGAARDAFGPQQRIAREGASALLAEADAVIERMAAQPEAFARGRARIGAWVKEHPIQSAFSSRPSLSAFMAEIREEYDAFAAVGAVSDTLENVSERLNTYAMQLPKQARWQAELMLSETAGDDGIQGALGDIRAVGTAARRANDLLADVPSTTEAGASVRDVVKAEREAVLAGVDRQRVQTLEYVTSERLAVLAALHDERLAVGVALHDARIDTLKEVDAIKTRAVETALAGLRDLVDYTIWRVAVLASSLMILAAVLGTVAYWLTVGRGRGTDVAG